MPNFCGYPDGPCSLSDGEHAWHGGDKSECFKYLAEDRVLHVNVRARPCDRCGRSPCACRLADFHSELREKRATLEKVHKLLGGWEKRVQIMKREPGPSEALNELEMVVALLRGALGDAT